MCVAGSGFDPRGIDHAVGPMIRSQARTFPRSSRAASTITKPACLLPDFAVAQNPLDVARNQHVW